MFAKQSPQGATTPTSMSTTPHIGQSHRWKRQRFSVADILICTVLGVVAGLVFWVYNGIGGAWYEAFNALTPGLGGLAVGPWLIAATLGGLTIRKPGAALYCELVAAALSAALGNQWAIATLYSGFAQGLGAELVFALFAYRYFGVVVASLAGAGSGVGAWVLEFVLGNAAKTAQFNVTYLGCLLLSGGLIAGVGITAVVRALVATGALDTVRAGKSRQLKV